MAEHNNFPDSVLFSGGSDNQDDIIELIKDEKHISDDDLPETLPILPVKNTVLFPGVLIPITVGRRKSVQLVRDAYETPHRIIGVTAQKNQSAEDPGFDDIYAVGTVARILKLIITPDGNTTIVIQGRSRFEIAERVDTSPYLKATAFYLEDEKVAKDPKVAEMIKLVRETAHKILQLNTDLPEDAKKAVDNIGNNSHLIHFIASHLNISVAEKQSILDESNLKDRITTLLSFMRREIKNLEIKKEIQNKTYSDIDQQQRDYFLRQQMKVLQDELGQDSPVRDIEDMRKRSLEKKWSQATADHFEKELSKLNRMNNMAPDYSVLLNYLEFMLDLPWGEASEDNLDLKRARAILDDDHYGLEKVKERIIEFLAVLKLTKSLKGPILCLYGPPGVGKTSLGKSVAKSLGREYVRMSLGGVHDEAEIRGHRKTYIGAMPGRILRNMKKASSSNPVFVLDEIDKVGNDFRGDPASALLEVLDPQQNDSFADHYLEIDYDLSDVLFLATANSLDTIHPALRDRMEIIEITGYTVEEKLQIAKKHLVPKSRKEHGLNGNDIRFRDEALVKLIEGYTRESGVRKLEQRIASVVRNVATKVATESEYTKSLKAEHVEDILGAPVFDKEIYQDNSFAGVVTGLAWTRVGGDILFIESGLSRGKGKLTLSGSLGDVMKESATTALSYLKAHAEDYGIDYRIFDKYDLHVHVPAGAVPKDGPSAGIAMLTSMTSAFTQRKIKAHLAMTGEITLRGKVLPVGGIKEKILAAKRAGIRHIILSKRNKKDIEEIDTQYIKDLQIMYVDTADEVLQEALLKSKVDKPKVFTPD